MKPLSRSQESWLRHLAGQEIHPRLLDPRGKRQVIYSLIDLDLITTDGWRLTDKGRAELERLVQPR